MLSRRLQSASLKNTLSQVLPKHAQMIKEFRAQHGEKIVGSIDVNAIYNGMRGMKAMIWEGSVLDANEGIRFRGLTIPEFQDKLTNNKLSEFQPEALLWLLLTGKVPVIEEVKDLSSDLNSRAALPKYVEDIIDTCPIDLHPMAQFSMAVLATQKESVFASKYMQGMHKSEYWEYTLEDSLNLIAKLPAMAARIYRNVYRDGKHQFVNEYDWSKNFSHMLGFTDDGFVNLMRMYLMIHTDHEGGNVSAHASHLVGSALSDPYYAFSAALNGLAGPLHGLANQQVLHFLLEMQKSVGEKPTDQEIKDFIWKLLKSGQVMPGYGHAVLRKT
eukprot:NODE_298_length_11435_cov_0.210303.p3 type:complete len:329 gc:universal NODE_298_length_11435_cov_0.210303:2105-3091(+)